MFIQASSLVGLGLLMSGAIALLSWRWLAYGWAEAGVPWVTFLLAGNTVPGPFGGLLPLMILYPYAPCGAHTTAT